MSESNVQSVVSSEPIEQVAGNSAVSFDDLESVMESSKSGAKSASTEKTKATEAKSKTKEKEDGKSQEESKESKESGSEKSSERLLDKKGAEDKTPAPSVKTFKVKNGDAEIELRADTLVDVKVDGKVQKVPLQQALDSFSSGKHIQEQLSSLKKDKEVFETDKTNLKTFLHDVNDHIGSQDILGAFKVIGDATGQDGQKLYEEMLTKITEQTKKFAEMTPEQIQQVKLEQENKHWREQELKQKQKMSEEAETKAEWERIDAVAAKHNITRDVFAQTYDRMVELAKVGKVDPSKITAADVGEFYAFTAADVKAANILKDVDSNPETIDKDKAELRDIAVKNPDLSEDDLRQIALEVYGKESAKRLAKKITKMERQADKKPVSNPATDPWSFDQLA